MLKAKIYHEAASKGQTNTYWDMFEDNTELFRKQEGAQIVPFIKGGTQILPIFQDNIDVDKELKSATWKDGQCKRDIKDKAGILNYQFK